MTTYLPIVVVALAIAYAVWMRRASFTGGANAAAGVRDFLARSGYRHVELREAPLEQQVERSLELAAKQAKGDSQTRMVRAVDGSCVYWEQWTQLTGSGYAMGCQWSVPLAAAPRALVHVADQRLMGAGKAVREFMTSHRREFRAAYPTRISVGDPAFDARFAVFCENEHAARAVLADAEFRASLHACEEVDLVVAPSQILFRDPSMANQRAAMGGSAGMLAAVRDPDRAAAATLMVHDRIAAILLRLAALVR